MELIHAAALNLFVIDMATNVGNIYKKCCRWDCCSNVSKCFHDCTYRCEYQCENNERKNNSASQNLLSNTTHPIYVGENLISMRGIRCICTCNNAQRTFITFNTLARKFIFVMKPTGKEIGNPHSSDCQINYSRCHGG